MNDFPAHIGQAMEFLDTSEGSALAERTRRMADEGYCCLDGCCGPGSWCCTRANPHTHGGPDGA